MYAIATPAAERVSLVITFHIQLRDTSLRLKQTQELCWESDFKFRSFIVFCSGSFLQRGYCS